MQKNEDVEHRFKYNYLKIFIVLKVIYIFSKIPIKESQKPHGTIKVPP